MQAQFPQAFEREMTCTPAEWLRSLPAAIGAHAWEQGPDGAIVHIGEGVLRLRWHVAEPRVLGLVRLPRLLVSFAFEAVDAGQRNAFMRRFDLYLQRGGG